MRLIRAAERLFAERGIEVVSLREISRAAGQGNTNALQYHFGDRDGVLDAILQRHGRDLDVRRWALLDEYHPTHGDPRAVAAILVRPIVSKLDDPDGGPEYLQIAAEVVNRSNDLVVPDKPSVLSDPTLSDEDDSVNAWAHLATPFIPARAAGHPFHRRYLAVRFAYLEAGRRARNIRTPDHRLFTAHVIDLVTTLLSAPLSEETHRALETKGATRRANRR